MNQPVIILLLLFLAVAIIVFLYYKYRKVKKDLKIQKITLEYKEKKEKLQEKITLHTAALERIQSTTLNEAKRKNQIHSFQNSFTKFLYFIHKQDSQTAYDYAQKSAKFYRNALNQREYNSRNWSISDELNLMRSFFLIENIPPKNI